MEKENSFKQMAAVNRLRTARSLALKVVLAGLAGSVLGPVVTIMGEPIGDLSGLGSGIMLCGLVVGFLGGIAALMVLHARCPFCGKSFFNRLSWLSIFESRCYSCEREMDSQK